MAFLTLPPGIVKKLLAGIKDELTPLSSSRTSYITTMACPRCKTPLTPFIYGPQPFSPHDPLPRTMARCDECGYVIDPMTKIVMAVGQIITDPGKVEP